MLIRDPVVQKLNGRTIAERGVAAIPVAEQPDVVEQVGNSLGTGRVARTIHPVVLQAVDEALRGHVVPAVARRLVEQTAPYSLSLPRNTWFVYCLPQSE